MKVWKLAELLANVPQDFDVVMIDTSAFNSDSVYYKPLLVDMDAAARVCYIDIQSE